MKITASNFDSEVIHSSLPVLLDFWADWCGPCKMLSPVIEEIERDYADKIKVGSINVDEEEALAQQHSIASIPCIIVYNAGKIYARQVGVMPRQLIENLFKELLP
jgi:thioredoxin 1